jgi:hypothetical protein
MKRFCAIVAVALVVAGATTTAASARRYHHYGMFGFRGSNAELRGNNANSGGGRYSASNPHNTAGEGSGGAGTR